MEMLKRCIPDSIYLRLLYYRRLGGGVNLKNPKTFNEKLQWLKLYDRNPEYTRMADKCDAKEYVANIIGRQHIIPTLGVWTRFDEINFDELPEKFVLKCTHDSGGIVICNDKDKFDKPAAKSKIEKSLKRNYYWAGREWPYKNIKPRIIAEKYLADAEDNQIADELRDYKFFCFHGKVRCFKIDFDRFTNHRANYYSTEKKLLKFGEKEFPPDFSKNLEIPPNINDMIRLAEKLSAGYPFIRVDLYDIAGQIYFGELTLYPACGFGAFIPPEWDLKLGEYLQLPANRSHKYFKCGDKK